MKFFLFLFLIGAGISTCKSNDSRFEERFQKMKELRQDTVNVVKLSDTLIIFEGTCRGCQYEHDFFIKDTADIISLVSIDTKDYNSPDVDGGSMDKNIILKPLKTGKTTFKLYKFFGPERSAEDSARAINYPVEVVE